jgi:hypothetical protein
MTDDAEIAAAVFGVLADEKQCPRCKEFFPDKELRFRYEECDYDHTLKKSIHCYPCFKEHFPGMIGFNLETDYIKIK